MWTHRLGSCRCSALLEISFVKVYYTSVDASMQMHMFLSVCWLRLELQSFYGYNPYHRYFLLSPLSYFKLFSQLQKCLETKCFFQWMRSTWSHYDLPRWIKICDRFFFAKAILLRTLPIFIIDGTIIIRKGVLMRISKKSPLSTISHNLVLYNFAKNSASYFNNLGGDFSTRLYRL